MKLKNKKLLWLCILAALGVGIFFFANNAGPAHLPGGKLKVTASFYPLYFFSEEIGGEKIDVSNITPSGAEPHDYEPTPLDMARLEASTVIVLNGGGFESWDDNLKKNIDAGKTLIVSAAEGLMTQQVEENGRTITDPHVWLAPLLAEKMIDKIAAAFIEADPTNSDYYEKNASALRMRLGDLDQKYRNVLASCRKKDIITSHGAFGYVASAYGLNQIPITGLSPDAEPSLQELKDLVTFARKHNVAYIFFESLASPKLSRTIADEVGAQTLVLNPIEGLSPEELRQGKNYFTNMESNLTHLQTALQCQA